MTKDDMRAWLEQQRAVQPEGTLTMNFTILDGNLAMSWTIAKFPAEVIAHAQEAAMDKFDRLMRQAIKEKRDDRSRVPIGDAATAGLAAVTTMPGTPD